LDFVLRLNDKVIKLQRFGSWILLPYLGKKEEEDRGRACWPAVQLISDLEHVKTSSFFVLTEGGSRIQLPKHDSFIIL
jgi:hypothetical protein